MSDEMVYWNAFFAALGGKVFRNVNSTHEHLVECSRNIALETLKLHDIEVPYSVRKQLEKS